MNLHVLHGRENHSYSPHVPCQRQKTDCGVTRMVRLGSSRDLHVLQNYVKRRLEMVVGAAAPLNFVVEAMPAGAGQLK